MFYKHGKRGYSGRGIMNPKRKTYIDWSEHELSNITLVNDQFSVGKVWHNGWVLFHTETLQAVCIGLKSAMCGLAKKLLSFDHDVANATWSSHDGGTSYQVRSKTTLTSERTMPAKVYREYV